MHTVRLPSSCVILSLILAGAACSEGSQPPSELVTVRPAVESVSIDPSSATVVVGESLQLVPTLRDASGNMLSDRSITWNSATPSTLSVSTTGLVTGIAPTTQRVRVTATSEGKSGSTDLLVVSVAQFTHLTMGTGHTCGIAASKAAYCWGSNASGQLGTNGSTTVVRETPQLVSGTSQFNSLFAGDSETCGITMLGPTYCWGEFSGRPIPTPLNQPVQFVEFAPSSLSMCARTGGNLVYCWGQNTFGELGNSTFIANFQAAPVSGGLQFAQIASGSLHYCARTTTNQAYCWGENRYGAIGDGSNVNRSSPTRVGATLQFITIDTGPLNTCGITTNGAAYCWGLNSFGQVGDNSTTDRTIPTLVSGGLQFVSISVGMNHTCARTSTNAIYCWGFNGTGLLGDNTNFNRSIPTRVVGELSFVDVQAGWQSCGRTSSGATYCWGGGSLINPVLRPTPVPAP